MIDRRGAVRAVNRRWRSLFWSPADTGGTPGLAAWFPDEPSVISVLDAAADTGASARLHARRVDNVPFTLAIEVAIDPASGDLVCVGREIAGDDLLSESQRYLDVAFEIAPVGMALFDTNGRYVRVNDALCRLLDRSRAELIGERDQTVTHPDDRAADVEAAWRILNGELDVWQTEKRFITGSGDIVWTIANLTFLRDPDGRPLSWLGQFQDITEHKRHQTLLGHLATHDELTLIANRRGLIQELTRRLDQARRYHESGALLLLDLDGFKAINDREGHSAGDALLVRTAHALQHRLRTSDFIARLGGDEFAVVLPYADAAAAETVASGLLHTLRALPGASVSASCGIALYAHDVLDIESLLADADRAMYRAKAAGRGCLRSSAGR